MSGHHAFKSLNSITEIEDEFETEPPPQSSHLDRMDSPTRAHCSVTSLSSTPRSLSLKPLDSQLAFGQLSDPVQGTTDDASISKFSAITAGYYEDPYCYHTIRHPTRRSPLINRGYYSRVAAIRKAVSLFLNSIPPTEPIVQVVNLGAGLDTIYFWVADFWSNHKIIFYEIDFLEVLTKKVALLTKKEALWTRLQQVEGCRSVQSIESDLQMEKAITINDTLHLIPVDLRDCPALEKLLVSAGFDGKRPTLILSECALIYLPSHCSDQLIAWAANATSAPSAFVVYETINPHDAFGRTMVRNLESRGCPLLGIHDYPTLDSQKERFLKLGWDKVTIADMNRIYDHFLDKFELIRIQSLELFDEVEEWRLIQNHYFVSIAVKGYHKNGEVDLGYLSELSMFWDKSQEVLEDMPRFTTEELRSSQTSHSGQFSTPLLVASGTHPKLCPGPLSPLMCPEASNNSHLSPNSSSTGLTRKWSLTNSPSENDLAAMILRARSSFGAFDSPRNIE